MGADRFWPPSGPLEGLPPGLGLPAEPAEGFHASAFQLNTPLALLTPSGPYRVLPKYTKLRPGSVSGLAWDTWGGAGTSDNSVHRSSQWMPQPFQVTSEGIGVSSHARAQGADPKLAATRMLAPGTLARLQPARSGPRTGLH